MDANKDSSCMLPFAPLPQSERAHQYGTLECLCLRKHSSHTTQDQGSLRRDIRLQRITCEFVLRHLWQAVGVQDECTDALQIFRSKVSLQVGVSQGAHHFPRLLRHCRINQTLNVLHLLLHNLTYGRERRQACESAQLFRFASAKTPALDCTAFHATDAHAQPQRGLHAIPEKSPTPRQAPIPGLPLCLAPKHL